MNLDYNPSGFIFKFLYIGTDTVKYSGLVVVKEYTVKGVLMSKKTGKGFMAMMNG